MNQFNKKEPKVSIILPNYNSSKTITKTISSIVNQSYKNWELIIVDDNSDELTKNILLKYRKRHSCAWTVGFEKEGWQTTCLPPWLGQLYRL